MVQGAHITQQGSTWQLLCKLSKVVCTSEKEKPNNNKSQKKKKKNRKKPNKKRLKEQNPKAIK